MPDGWLRGEEPGPWLDPAAGAPITGAVPAGSVAAVPADAAELVPLRFDRAIADGLVIPLDARAIAVGWSQFEQCRFTQRRSGRALLPDGTAPQGSFGARPSLYRRCVFVGVRFKALGGFSLGRATYEECVFENCRWSGHLHHDADLLRCRFVGAMDGCVWLGVGGEPVARPNRFEGNDFREARIGANVGWRGSLDLDGQMWPPGYLPQAG